MRQMTIMLLPEEVNALKKAASDECRRWKDHARYLLVKALESKGYLNHKSPLHNLEPTTELSKDGPEL